MEMHPHCTVPSPARGRSWLPDLLGLALLTATVLVVHGFHPWAEDGGLYVAGVELLLQPSLFPADRAFVTAPLHYSVFAPAVAAMVRLSHASLAAVLLGLYLLTTLLLLYAALRLARRCFPAEPTAKFPAESPAKSPAQWAGVALLATWWTLPVAGTSLLLMDPYLTARSFSTPFTLLALDQVLQLKARPRRLSVSEAPSLLPWLRSLPSPLLRCGLLLAATAAVHPLMAIHAALFCLVLALIRQKAPPRTFALLAVACLALVGLLQATGRPEAAAAQIAVQSRYYWFLSQWRWFEWLGLIGPLAVLFGISRLIPNPKTQKSLTASETSQPSLQPSPSTPESTPSALLTLCRGSLFVGALGMAASVLFVQEHFAAHTAGRLQPLRSFLPIYALLPLLLGGTLSRFRRHLWQKVLPWALVLASAAAMFTVQRETFPQSPHIEWPGKSNPNPWAAAFVWARRHTAADALFALDARYVNTSGEDAQGFRALAHRSAVPDFSKDGGEAANFPALAPAWLHGAEATAHLSDLSDRQRAERLRGFGVTFLVLSGIAKTSAPCPYRNATVKICSVPWQVPPRP